MTWLEGKTHSSVRPGSRLREHLEKPYILQVPGAHNALAGLLAKNAGFEALYISGAGLTLAMGLPDLGIMGLDELSSVTKTVSRATDLPLIVDGDVGYGGALNAMRTVQELENSGAAAVHIEDQQLPKKCGHLNDKLLIPASDAAAKIKAAKKAASDLVIIARTDAAGVEGLEKAIERSKIYKDAGADVIFPDALASADEFRRFADEVPGWKMANMTEFGRTPHFTATQFQQMGFDIVIWPATSARVEAFACRDLYNFIRDTEGTAGFEDRMLTREELYSTIRYHDFESLDASVAQSIVPQHTGDDTCSILHKEPKSLPDK